MKKNIMKKSYLLFFGLMFGSIQLSAQVNSNPGSHNWSSSSAWVGGVVPLSTQEVNITSNSTITLDTPIVHDTTINILSGGNLSSVNIANFLTVNNGDINLSGFSSTLDFTTATVNVKVIIDEGHLINGGFFTSGDLTILDSEGTIASENTADLYIKGNMSIDSSTVFENNAGAISISKKLFVCENCDVLNNAYGMIGDIENLGNIENYDAFSVSDSVYNSGYIFSDNNGFYISGDFINTGDYLITDTMDVQGDFINQGTFTNDSGSVNIVNNLLNEGALLGAGGFFQIGQVSTQSASGSMAGTIDVCDTTLTGSYIDNLSGTVDFLTVTFCTTSYASIENNKNMNAIMPYPNPANTEFYINGLEGKTNILIYSTDGRLLFNDDVFKHSVIKNILIVHLL